MKLLSIIFILVFGLSAFGATFTVTNLNDNGFGSLRQAISDAKTIAEANTINFQNGLSGTIILTSGELAVTGNLTITNSTGANSLLISGNNTSRVFFVNQNANLTINGVTVTKGNGTGITIPGFNGYGGGILNIGTLTLTNSIVSGNTAALAGGGGIYNQGSTMTTNSTVSGNTAGYGGGIANNDGTMTLTNSTVSDNTAVYGGGGGINNDGTMTLTNSIVSGNTTGQYGGGINNNFGATTTLTNSTVSGNTAVYGGGIANSFGTLNLTSVTVTQNKSTGTTCIDCAGGINNFDTANLKNTIVAGNTVANASAPPDFGGIVAATSSYNLIGNGQGTTGISNTDANSNQVGSSASPIDAMLAPLANNGGATQTHALLPGSPAINAGNNEGAPATDQRGFARISGGIIDIGAFEYQSVARRKKKLLSPTQ